MKYGIAVLSVIAIRKEMSHRSEQISQLLFGETYQILQKWERPYCLKPLQLQLTALNR